MTLKIYGAALSPYVAKVMIQTAAKGLDIPVEMPPGGVGSDEYKKLNPTGKVPSLDIDGTVIPESAAIVTYIENTQGGPSLRPEDPVEAAKAVAITMIGDLYIGENLGALFGQLNPKERSEEITASRLDALKAGLTRLEAFVEPGPFAHGGKMSIADCTLAPILFYVTTVLPLFGLKEPLAESPKVAAYWEAIQKNDAVAGVIAQMAEAVAKMSGN